MSVIEITSENFEKEVASYNGTVLVDFWAPWCGPCRMMSPIVDEIAETNPNVKVGKVNVDEQSSLAAKFGIMSIPTVIVFKNGSKAATSVGLKSKAAIEAML